MNLNDLMPRALVIGTGLAGLSTALYLSEEMPVTLISKSVLRSGNTNWAQGGIAAAVSDSDSIENHIQDTLFAGAGLCNLKVVKNYVMQAPDRIRDLQKWGVEFDSNAKGIDLTVEAAHSNARVLHIKDHTGDSIHQKLADQILNNPNIELKENLFLIDFYTTRSAKNYCTDKSKWLGAYFLNSKTQKVESFSADHCILATGGAGRTYLYTSNWEGATGDGVAAAFRAGARVANLEFMQFHPTCLFHTNERNFLISEALRGEGGTLVNRSGERFMSKYSSKLELAPRDVVARSIDQEMKRTGDECVFLDMTKFDRTHLQERYPHIFQRCDSLGIDISKSPIPVVPAAHYTCGGVLTDINGKTDIENLFAVGEVSCNGFHGANRLASNSLLECLASSKNVCDTILGSKKVPNELQNIPDWRYTGTENEDELAVVHHIWDEVRRLMWNYVGIVRSNKRLERA
ncbi:MAG: L-aspartate oxidase, partial [Bdellovibrionales bacterium]|nr:L-aspartate oxidase [Bdellovibrionales bacterium]